MTSNPTLPRWPLHCRILGLTLVALLAPLPLAFASSNGAYFSQESRPLRNKASGSEGSFSFMYIDQCHPPFGYPLVVERLLLLACEPYTDPVAARLQELLRILNQSRDVLLAAPLSPGRPESPSDSGGGTAILTPAMVRRNQLGGIARMSAAVNQAIATRRAAGRRQTPGTPTAAARPSTTVVPYAQIVEGASQLRGILTDEIRANPNAQRQQALLNNVDSVLRDLGTLVPRLASSPAEARRAYQRYLECMRRQAQAEIEIAAEEEQRRIRGEAERQRHEAEWRRYTECRRQQRRRDAEERRAQAAEDAAGSSGDSSEEELDPLIELMPEAVQREYRNMLQEFRTRPAPTTQPTTIEQTPATGTTPPSTQAD